MKKFEFFADGEPKGQPRARAVIRGKRAGVFDPGTADSWKACVKLAAKEAGVAGLKLAGPLGVRMQFHFPRPAGHYKGGDRAKPLKPNAPIHKTGKPDADNAAKAVMDALTDIGAWHDDAQIVKLGVSKDYTFGAVGCYIAITELEAAHG